MQLRRPGAAVWLILLLALVVRVAIVEATPGYTVMRDAADYDRHARSIAAGDGYPDTNVAGGGPTAFRPPLYPGFLAVVYEVSGSSRTAGRLAQALLGTIAVALVGLIAWQIWGRRTGLVSMAVAAVAPPLVVSGAALLSEPLFLVFELGAVAAVLQHRRGGRSYGWVALAGALCGLAALTRTNGAIVALVLAVGAWTARPLLSRRALSQPALLLAVAALVIAPWTIRNAITMHAFIPVSTQVGYTLAATYNDAARLDPVHPSEQHYTGTEYSRLLRRADLDEVELGAELGKRARAYMRDHPGYVVQTSLRNTVRLLNLNGVDGARRGAAVVDIPRWLADLGVFGWYVIGAVALVGAFLPAARRVPRFVWGVPLLLFASAVIVLSNTRYRVVADPFVILLAAVALVAAWDRVVSRGHPGSRGATA
jgi:4-amino-4-deoxy-L-arabinose transferase-like glycosyltransferase